MLSNLRSPAVRPSSRWKSLHLAGHRSTGFPGAVPDQFAGPVRGGLPWAGLVHSWTGGASHEKLYLHIDGTESEGRPGVSGMCLAVEPTQSM